MREMSKKHFKKDHKSKFLQLGSIYLKLYTTKFFEA